MELRGKLDTFPLADVLRFIEEKGHTGYLGLRLEFDGNHYARRLLGSGLEERLLIEGGRLHGLSSLRSADTWCRLLVRGELISRSEEKALRERLALLGDLLLQTLTGVLDLEGGQVRERMELYLRERAAWLFAARGGDFWFEFEGPPPMPAGWQAVSLGDLVRQGPEYAQMLHSLFSRCPDPWARVQVITSGADDPPPDVLLPGEWETLARVNGRRAVEDLLRESRLPIYETATHLVSLREHGSIEIISEPAPREKVAPKVRERSRRVGRMGRWRGLLQIGRGVEEAPKDIVGRTCLLVNCLLEHAGEFAEELDESWHEILHTHPLASVLTLGEAGFDPHEFRSVMKAWGGNAEDWRDIEDEARDALWTLLSRFYHDLVVVGDKKRADAIFRRAWQDYPGDGDGIPKIEDLEAILPAA